MHRLIVNGELILYGLVGEMWDMECFTPRDVLDALVFLSGDFTCRLNSGGGIAMDGLAIYNALKMHDGKVTIVVDGAAMSAASLIAMAGDTVVMNQGALMMIHDPSGISFGNADDMQRDADAMDKMADQFAAIYAAKAKIKVSEARDIMKTETWYTADEAVDAGFADEVAAAPAATASIFDYRLYRKSPAKLTELATASATMFKPKAAPAAQPPKETAMDLETIVATQSARLKTPADDVRMFCNSVLMFGLTLVEASGLLAGAATMLAAKEALMAKLAPQTSTTLPAPVPAPAPAPATMSVTDVRDVMNRAGQAGLTLAETNVIVAASMNVSAAYMAIIDKVAEKNGTNAPSATSHVTEDDRDKFRQGASEALMAKVGHKDGKRNEFSGLTLSELARESLMIAGVSTARRMDRMLMIGTAFTGGGATMVGGIHTTSDFAYILQNVAAKSALKGFLEAEETFQLWTSNGSASDFKPIARADLGLFPSLLKVEEGAEYKYATIGDRGVTVVVATYGRMIAISRQAIINDDLSILGSLPTKMGRAAKRTVGNLVYGVLNDNPVLPDGVALFHADHGNLATVAANPTQASFEAAANAMGLLVEKDGDGNSVPLNIQPKFFLSGAHQFTAKQLLESSGSLDAQKSAAVVNTVKGLVQPITDRRITGNKWFFAADPNQVDTIEVTYLDGVQEPVVESKDGWTIDGTELKVRLDAGVNPLGYRGLHKNAGV
jgi:ATP-dependent protease ClpP protease subunit